MIENKLPGDNLKTNQPKKLFPVDVDGNWTNTVKSFDDNVLEIEQTLTLPDKKEVETGFYKKTHLPELDADIYILDADKSSGGVLPHGTACYLHKWDMILLRNDNTNFDPKNLPPSTFTIIAHELGHKEDHRVNKNVQKSSNADKEIQAWKHAIRLFGKNKKFDHGYAETDMEYYKNHY